MRDLLLEIRQVIRALGRRPGFAAAALITLALGIGACTAIFAVVHHTLLRQPPYHDPERLVRLRLESMGSAGAEEIPWSYPIFTDVCRDAAAFRAAAYAGWSFNLTGIETPERIPVEIVSAGYFPVLGVEAAHGRVFLPEEDRTPGSHRVALLGDELWRRDFGGDPDVVGKPIHLDGQPLTVVGILPPAFRGLTGRAEVWIPMMMAPELLMPRRLVMRFSHWHQVVARLAPRETPESGGAALNAALARVNRETPPPDGYGEMRAAAVTLREDRVEPALRKALLLLFGAVGFVLLIACVNVVNLLLVRALSLRRETAIRASLGAGRGRLVRRFVAESAVLGVAGGLLGLLVAWAGIRLAVVYGPVEPFTSRFGIEPLPGIELGAVRFGGAVFALNVLVSLLTGMLLGLAPALRASRIDLTAWIRQGVHPVGARLRSLGRLDPQSLLVAGEIALSVVLLIGAGLLIRSFLQLSNTRLGFDPGHVLTLRISHPYRSDESAAAAFDLQLLERVRTLPGVEAASLTNRLPAGGEGETALLSIAGKTFAEGAEPAVGVHMVTPGHFAALRIPLRRGRIFAGSDRAGAGRVALLNETAARRLFAGEDPLGQRIGLSIGWEEGDLAEVVGVVGDVRTVRPSEEPVPEVYVPLLQNPTPFVFLTVRSTGASEALVPAIRRAVRDLDPEVPLFDVRTLEERVEQAGSRLRFGTLLITLFAGVACLLAAVGLYGVIAYSVSGRTAEIGLRMALGARRAQVAGRVVRDGLAMSVAGLAAGLGLAVLVTRLLASFLYEVDSTDPGVFAGAAALLLLVSLLASYAPARRALRIDPALVLRGE